MNRQAILAYANASNTGEKITILRGLSLAYDHETVAAICEFIMEGRVPQTLPEATPPKKINKPRGMHARKK